MSKSIKPQVLVFTGSQFAKPLLAHLARGGYLAGVLLPSPIEYAHLAQEVTALAHELQQAGIHWQYLTRSQLIPEEIQSFEANCAIAAAFPLIFPEAVLNMFNTDEHKGIYNLHASALPLYAGPQPLYWQLRDNQPSSALALHTITSVIDSGNIIIKRDVPIHPLDTLASLHQRMSFEAIPVIEQWLNAISHSQSPLTGEPQVSCEMMHDWQRHARRPKVDDCRINFTQHTAAQISAMCRAGNGSAFSAFTNIKGLDVQILQATELAMPTFGVQPGTVLHVGEPEGLIICARKSTVRLDIIASPDGVFTGLAFADRFDIDAGSTLAPTSRVFTPQPA